MQLFNNMNIKKKLFSSFAVLTLFLVLAAIFGYTGINKVSGLMDSMYEEHYIASVTINGIKADINEARAQWLTLMGEKDKEKMDALKKTIQEELNRDIDEGFGILMKMEGTDAKMKASFKELKDVWDSFKETRDKQMFPLVYADKRDEAKIIAVGIQAERYKKMITISNVLIKSETEEAETAQKEARSMAQTAVLVLLALSLLGLAVSIIIALFISNNIASRVKGVAVAAEVIAKGDLTKEVNVSGGDEIGIMAASFKDMQQNLVRTVSQVREP